jgi:6,7-dimethyl-8-ribityllumazine synthase
MENKAGKSLAGCLDARGMKFAIVVSRFNSFITERLLAGALDGIERCGGKLEDVTVARVPGSFEIPIASRRFAESKEYDAVIALGAILRGETAHFEFIAQEVTRGLQRASVETGVAVGFGVLTCDTLEQAIDRAGLKSGNKGFDTALSVIEMANLMRQTAKKSSRR